MLKEFDLNGYWWLPDNPDNKVPGALKVNQSEGAQLELTGSLDSMENRLFRFEGQDIILGFTSNGKTVTLYKCISTNASMSFPGMYIQKFSPQFIFTGRHYNSKDEIRFCKIHVRYLHFDQWLYVSGFQVKSNAEKGKLRVEYESPESIELANLSDLTITVQFGVTSPILALDKITITQKSTVCFESKNEPKGFFDWLEVHGRFQDFLSLAALSPIYPTVIEAEPILCEGEKDTHQKVEWYYQLATKPDTAKIRSYYDMLVPYADISHDIGRYLANWYEKADQLKPVMDYFFSTMYAQKLYVEHRFLNLIGAIEFYHRRMYKGKVSVHGVKETVV